MIEGSPFIQIDDDGHFLWDRCPGWEGYRISGRAVMIRDKPMLTAVGVEPLDPDTRIPMSALRLSALPMAHIAALVLLGPTANVKTLGQLMRQIDEKTAPKHDPRAVVTVEQVAAAWKAAHEANLPERNSVAAELRIGRRTADRYIARARDKGLIPADRGDAK